VQRQKVDVGELLVTVRDYYDATALNAGVSLALPMVNMRSHLNWMFSDAAGGEQPGLKCIGITRRAGL